MGTKLGKRILSARLREGMTQAKLAEKIGVAPLSICNWENNKNDPNPDSLKKLTRVLGPLEKIESVDGAASNAFGTWLRKARDNAELSRAELAEQAGVSGLTIYNIESGRSENPQERTRQLLEKALKSQVPQEVREEIEEESSIEGLGMLQDFDPHDPKEWPKDPGVYVFYDISDRPIYVGKAKSIAIRVRAHEEKFWFKHPIVTKASYVVIKDETLRSQVEQVLIRFLKSNAVINVQHVERE